MALINSDSLFVRDEVIRELDKKLTLFADDILDRGLDYDDSKASPFYDVCVYDAMNFEIEVTEDEFLYISENIQIACAIQDMMRQGKIIKENGVYRLVDE